MTDQIKPTLYLVRPDGRYVPLIAADELPHNVRVKGLPRVLRPGDVVDYEKPVGKIKGFPGQFYEVTGVNVSCELSEDPTSVERPASKTLAAGPHILSSPVPIDALHQSVKPALIPQLPLSYGIFDSPSGREISHMLSPSVAYAQLSADPNQAQSTDAAAHAPAQRLPAWKDLRPLAVSTSHLTSGLGQKIYCSHWMRKGECDYAQQGCKYRHEMPLDKQTLNHLGFRDLPQWYRDLYNLPSLTAISGSGAAGNAKVNSRPDSLQASRWSDLHTVHTSRRRTRGQAQPRITHNAAKLSAIAASKSEGPAAMNAPTALANSITATKLRPNRTRQVEITDLCKTETFQSFDFAAKSREAHSETKSSAVPPLILIPTPSQSHSRAKTAASATNNSIFPISEANPNPYYGQTISAPYSSLSPSPSSSSPPSTALHTPTNPSSPDPAPKLRVHDHKNKIKGRIHAHGHHHSPILKFDNLDLDMENLSLIDGSVEEPEISAMRGQRTKDERGMERYRTQCEAVGRNSAAAKTAVGKDKMVAREIGKELGRAVEEAMRREKEKEQEREAKKRASGGWIIGGVQK